jgi:glycosyltransferase involved in cell wall biosynthesis
MGRRHHLASFYRKNIESALTYPHVEFVLLDYGSTDGLRDWVETELREWLDRGIVRYFRTVTPRVFHMAHAKNVAHRLANGDVLLNLDADNWFEGGFAEEVGELFASGERTIGIFGAFRSGCMGRIALRREEFFSLGGYDEDLRGWGFEDADLVRRALRFGLAAKFFDLRHALALQHSDMERMRFAPSKNKGRQRRENQRRSTANLMAERLVANAGREWGRIQLESTRRG